MGRSLFERELVNCYKNGNLNDLHDRVRQDVKGVQVWQQVDHVVMLDEIMRQKGDDTLIAILQHLRLGNCTEADKLTLDKYVLSNDDCSSDTKALTCVSRWAESLDKGCPLIVYTNIARDQHNVRMADAFAMETGQEYHIYYSRDLKGCGRSKRQLTGLAAEVAWDIPVKEANDLGGHMLYIPGMAVFCTENIATELGISNGSHGQLVSVVYEDHGGCRYAISADVDFESYNNTSPTAPNSHRITLKPVGHPVHYSLPGSTKVYTANRWQLPLIPAFAFTSHNTQGRSLDYCCIDLASCASIQSVYVMLSHVRSLNGLCILRPFPLSRIKNHISEELHTELKRTQEKADRTKAFSRHHLSWFYEIIPEHFIDHLREPDFPIQDILPSMEV
jgi:hypothetical protein